MRHETMRINFTQTLSLASCTPAQPISKLPRTASGGDLRGLQGQQKCEATDLEQLHEQGARPERGLAKHRLTETEAELKSKQESLRAILWLSMWVSRLRRSVVSLPVFRKYENGHTQSSLLRFKHTAADTATPGVSDLIV